MDPLVPSDIGRDVYYILSLHDRALLQTIQLNDYREELTTKARNFMLIGNRGRALLLMKRRCVADGMKHMYSVYRQRKCQKLVSALSLTIPSLHENAIIPGMEPETRHEELQVEKYAQTMMIAQCSFSRVD